MGRVDVNQQGAALPRVATESTLRPYKELRNRGLCVPVVAERHRDNYRAQTSALVRKKIAPVKGETLSKTASHPNKGKPYSATRNPQQHLKTSSTK